MTRNQIKSLLLVCPPTRNHGGDSRLRKALQAVEKDPELHALFNKQLRFDAQIADALQAISAPESLMASAEDIESALSRRASSVISLRDPAVFPVAVAFLLLVGLGLWLFFGKMSSLPGSSELWQVVLAGDNAQASPFDSIALKIDALDDWFAMKGMNQFEAPQVLKNLDAVGVRVFTSSEVSVAMVAVAHPRMFFYVFNGERLGISPPSDGIWKILERDRKTIAVTGQGDLVFVMEIKGNRADMQRVLQGLNSSGK